MLFSQKLQLIRKNEGFTQEALAEKLAVSRQAVAKWEYGRAYPDISNLIQISSLFNVTIDYLVKDQECTVNCLDDNETDIDQLIKFRLEAKSKYAMNYMGRVLDQNFSGDFLKEALRQANKKMPFRGPEHYQSGQYIYKCNVVGDFTWFQGYEEIFYNNIKVYECFFHGGLMK